LRKEQEYMTSHQPKIILFYGVVGLCLFLSGCSQWDIESYHSAIARDEVDDVERLLDKGVDVESKNLQLRTALHEAATKPRTDLVRVLLDRGAQIEAKDRYGFTPLHYSAMHDRLETTKLLIEAGADINALNMYDWAPLHTASFRGSQAVTELLLTNKVDIDAKSKDGDTPLHLAAESGHVAIVRLLLADGVKVDAQTESGQTPLHLAVIKGHNDVAEILLEKNANVNVVNKEGKTALHEAVSTKRYEVTGAAMYETMSGQTVTDHRGAYRFKADPRIIRLLIDKGADINARDNKGRTPITTAKENGLGEIAGLMVDGVNRYAGQEQTRLEELQAVAWEDAVKQDSINAFVDFHRRFGTKASEVRERILSLVSNIEVNTEANELAHHVPALLSGEKIVTELMPEARQGDGNKYIYTWRKVVFVWKCGWITYVAFPDNDAPLEFEVSFVRGIPLVVPPLPLKYCSGKGVVLVIDSQKNKTTVYKFGG
jgi:ankyrin repeat protein